MPAKYAPLAVMAAVITCSVPHLFADPLLPTCIGGPAALRAAYGALTEDSTIDLLSALCPGSNAGKNRVEHYRNASLDSRKLAKLAKQGELSLPSGAFHRASLKESGDESQRASGIHGKPAKNEFSSGPGLPGIAFTPWGAPFLTAQAAWFGQGNSEEKENSPPLSVQAIEFKFKAHPGSYAVISQRTTTSAPGQPVPEPASLLLLSSGLAGIGLAARARRAVRRKIASWKAPVA